MRYVILFPYTVLFTILLIVSMLSYINVAPDKAQVQGSHLVPKVQNSSGHLTILILDMSSPMNVNDGQQIRCSAANAYIDLGGQGDVMGVIALTSPLTGPQTAQIWQEPTSVEVLSQREDLKQVIANRPPDTPSCQHPSGNTPIFDALKKALDMLTVATQAKNITGSVILLTDGNPEPAPDVQKASIRTLLPQFQQNHWPIDTIALGGLQQYRPFLNEIASHTDGIPYDDEQGVVSDVSPINLTSFFIDIFPQRVKRTVTPYIPLTTLNDEAHAYNFPVDDHTKHLDIVAVKEPGIAITVTTPRPDAQTWSPSKHPVDVFFSPPDPYYEIISISGPSTGVWQLNVSGTGRFLVNGLAISWLQIAIASPAQEGMLLSLDSSFCLEAMIVDGRSPNDPVTAEKGLKLDGNITYQKTTSSGSVPFMMQLYHLKKADDPGVYQTLVTIPHGALPGTYLIQVQASGSTDMVFSDDTRTIHMEHFPQPTIDQGHTTQVVITPWLQNLYNLPILNLLGNLVLPDRSSQASGVIRWQRNIYPDAYIDHADLLANGTAPPQSIEVTNKGQGAFQLKLQAVPDGTYMIRLYLKGTFEGISGNLETKQQMLTITSTRMLPAMYLLPLAIVALYLLLLLSIVSAIGWGGWRRTGPMPFGCCVLATTSAVYPFKKARRRFRVSFWRNTLYSEQVYIDEKDVIDTTPLKTTPDTRQTLPAGLKFRFCHNKDIKVCKQKKGEDFWWALDENDKEYSLSSKKYQVVKKLMYRLVSVDKAVRTLIYTVSQD